MFGGGHRHLRKRSILGFADAQERGRRMTIRTKIKMTAAASQGKVRRKLSTGSREALLAATAYRPKTSALGDGVHAAKQ